VVCWSHLDFTVRLQSSIYNQSTIDASLTSQSTKAAKRAKKEAAKGDEPPAGVHAVDGAVDAPQPVASQMINGSGAVDGAHPVYEEHIVNGGAVDGAPPVDEEHIVNGNGAVDGAPPEADGVDVEWEDRPVNLPEELDEDAIDDTAAADEAPIPCAVDEAQPVDDAQDVNGSGAVDGAAPVNRLEKLDEDAVDDTAAADEAPINGAVEEAQLVDDAQDVNGVGAVDRAQPVDGAQLVDDGAVGGELTQQEMNDIVTEYSVQRVILHMKGLADKKLLKELEESMESLTKQKKALENVDYSAFEDDKASREAERDNDMRFISTKIEKKKMEKEEAIKRLAVKKEEVEKLVMTEAKQLEKMLTSFKGDWQFMFSFLGGVMESLTNEETTGDEKTDGLTDDGRGKGGKKSKETPYNIRLSNLSATMTADDQKSLEVRLETYIGGMVGIACYHADGGWPLLTGKTLNSKTVGELCPSLLMPHRSFWLGFKSGGIRYGMSSAQRDGWFAMTLADRKLLIDESNDKKIARCAKMLPLTDLAHFPSIKERRAMATARDNGSIPKLDNEKFMHLTAAGVDPKAVMSMEQMAAYVKHLNEKEE